MMKALLNLNNKTIRNLGTMIVGGFVALGVMISATPIINSMNERNVESSRLINELNQVKGKVTEYSAMKGKKDGLDATSQFLMSKFPEAANVPGLLQDINAAAISVGLSPNLITNVTIGTPTQVVEPLGITGEAVCGSLTPGEFAKIIPDLKNSTSEKTVYVMCTEKPIENIASNAFYNAATNNAARTCSFKPDASSGTLFYVGVSCKTLGTILPALKEESINVSGETGRFPSRPILAQVTGQVAQMSVVISLDTSVNVNTLSKFVSALYGMERAISISSIKVGITNDRNGISYSVISGYVYSHTSIITGDAISTEEGQG
jgi:hypothetical protein